jgi:hypothetical protein
MNAKEFEDFLAASLFLKSGARKKRKSGKSGAFEAIGFKRLFHGLCREVFARF